MSNEQTDLILKSEYQRDRGLAANLEDLTEAVGTDQEFRLRRAMNNWEAFTAFASRVPPSFAIEHLALVEELEPFKGVFSVTVRFVWEDGYRGSLLKPVPVNEKGIIIPKLKHPDKEKGYFLKVPMQENQAA